MYYSLRAFILKRQTYRDYDLLITVYSLRRGKLFLHARGAKRIKSKLAGHLEPVSLSDLNVIAGRNFDQLIGAASRQAYQNIKNNYQKAWQALSFLNLVDQLTLEGHSDPRIFKLIYNYLNFLEKHSQHYLFARVAAGFKVLALLGMNPAAKPGAKYRSYINFIINQPLQDVIKHAAISRHIQPLAAELDKEIAIVKNL